MIFTDTNIVVAHRNPLGFVVACFDPKSFLLPRDAQKVAKKWPGVSEPDLQLTVKVDLAWKCLLKRVNASHLDKRKGEWDEFLHLDFFWHVFRMATVCLYL